MYITWKIYESPPASPLAKTLERAICEIKSRPSLIPRAALALPAELSKFEAHLRQPVRIHNIRKKMAEMALDSRVREKWNWQITISILTTNHASSFSLKVLNLTSKAAFILIASNKLSTRCTDDNVVTNDRHTFYRRFGRGLFTTEPTFFCYFCTEKKRMKGEIDNLDRGLIVT